MLAQLGAMLAHLGARLAQLGGYVGPSWGQVGPAWGSVGPAWGYVGPSWGLMLADLGGMLAQLGRVFGPMLGHVDPSGATSVEKIENAQHTVKYTISVGSAARGGGPFSFWGSFWEKEMPTARTGPAGPLAGFKGLCPTAGKKLCSEKERRRRKTRRRRRRRKRRRRVFVSEGFQGSFRPRSRRFAFFPRAPAKGSS